jgi:hypothetical protein
MNKYLRSFVIGSSFPVFIIYFIAVQSITTPKKYTFETYSIIAPLFLGTCNMLSLYISELYNIELRQRLLITSILLPLLVCLYAYFGKIYKFTNWTNYFIIVLIIYIFVFNIIVYYLETHV